MRESRGACSSRSEAPSLLLNGKAEDGASQDAKASQPVGESKGWGFVVPSLHITGSAPSREEAERRVIDAVLFAFEGIPEQDYDDDVTEVSFLDIDVKPEPPAKRALA